MNSSQVPSTLGQKLLTLRETQGLSLRTLAEKSELSASFISQVERDEASPSIASLERITQALGVDLAQLFSREPAEPVVRKQDRDKLESGWSRGSVESLSRVPGKMHPRMITLKPGGGTGFLSAEVNEMFALVIQGTIKAKLRDTEVQLEEGDALHTLSDHPLSGQALVELTNPSTEPATVLLASLY